MTDSVSLTLAISQYDLVADLVAGRVVPEGIKLTSLVSMPVEEIFYRFIMNREWDVSEMSMGKYASLLSQGDNSFAAIPVFPSRIFRLASIFIRREGTVSAPKDLVGKRVGVPEWAQTAAIFTRGALAHYYGVDLTKIKWVQAGVNKPGRIEKVAVNLPKGIELERRSDATLSDMLVKGEIDAILSARVPSCINEGHPAVRRMFEDFIAVEGDYYKKTGVFPIMHVIAMRREILDRHPWVAGNLFKAFDESRRRSLLRAFDDAHPQYPIPWCFEYAKRAKDEIFGAEYWPYGIEPNRKTLDAFVTYAYEQGVCHRLLKAEELFAKQTHSAYAV